LGADFSVYADNWRRQHMVAIATMGEVIVNRSRATTHVLVLHCNYKATVGRSKDTLIQIDGTDCVALTTLTAEYGPDIADGFAGLSRDVVASTRKKSTYYYVMSMIYNRDLETEAPLAKLSYLGCDNSGGAMLMSSEQLIGLVNAGR